MIIPFFLTRQTANLMEDFAREVKDDGPALFLLYGENGVGKTRLLQELCQSRFGERRVHWLDLGTGDSADGTRFDYSHGIEELFEKAENGDIIIADHFEETLKKTRHQLFLSWSSNGVDKNLNLIIGSSNEGFNELRQLAQQYQVQVQSFQQMPFSADEVESFLGFCLYPDEPVARLKIPGPVRKQLVETQGYVGRIIDVIEHFGKQIKSPAAAGPQSVRQGSKAVVGVMLLFVVAVGAGWFFLQDPFVAGEESLVATPAPAATQAQAPAISASEQSVATRDDAAAETALAASPETDSDSDDGAAGTLAAAAIEAPARAEVVDETATVNETMAVDQATAANETMAADKMAAADETTAVDATAAVDEVAANGLAGAEAKPAEPAMETQPAAEAAGGQADEVAAVVETAVPEPSEATADEAALPAPDVSEPGTVPDSEAVIDEAPVAAETAGSADPVIAGSVEASADGDAEVIAAVDLPGTGEPLPGSNWDRFARELGDSKDWIGRHEDAVGTIQILLLTFDSFDADVYYQYVANLARKNVDTDRLHVFKTLTGNKEVYSVFYGEYASRPAALRAIDELPAVLRDTSPIPRSVGGIRQEIRRLQNKN